MVNIYRFDPRTDLAVQNAVDRLARVVLAPPPKLSGEMAAAAKLQAAYRGAAIRRQLARLGDLKGDTLAVRRLGSTPGQVGLGIFSSTAIFVGSREQQDRRARTLASDLGFSEHAVIAAFRARDRDGSGTLSKRELRNALSDLGVKLDRTEISAQLACYDADLDGALG